MSIADFFLTLEKEGKSPAYIDNNLVKFSGASLPQDLFQNFMMV